MPVFRSIIFSAVIVGLVVGTIITVVEQFDTVPLILKAEIYERSAEGAVPASVSPSGHSEHDHDAAAWEPRDGLERSLFTTAANILTAIGFSLLLGGLYALRGHPISWREGILWGIAGFAVRRIGCGELTSSHAAERGRVNHPAVSVWRAEFCYLEAVWRNTAPVA